MPSPFPGMDPYLESHWRDVHHRLITYASDAIQEALPPELRARVEERLLEGDEGMGGWLFPDVRVVEHRPQRQAGDTAASRAATEPLIVEATREPLTEGYIQIIDVSSGNRIVTIVEVLSPTNKAQGNDMREYQRKQREIVRSDTNLVEIDLLRSGRHVLAVPRLNLAGGHRTPYMVCVRRATAPTKAEIYLIALSQKLPTVKVPLRPGDADVPLDLQALIDQCYRRGRYEGDLDYRRDPDPPLTGAEADWTMDLLRGKGLRPPAAPKKRRPRKPPRSSEGA